MTKFNYKLACTHAGTFHADDVFSAALLKLINPDINIIRKNDICNINSDCLIFDIGGGKFDHHQFDAEYRDNGKKYASFGLLWREFSHLIVSSPAVIYNIDEKFIQPLDESDNFGYSNSYSDIVASFNFTWLEKENISDLEVYESENDKRFNSAVEVAIAILKRVIKKEEANVEASKYVKKTFDESDDKEIIVLEKSLPWKETLIETSAIYVVYPSSRGGWNAQVVPAEYKSPVAKKDFPYNWAGLRNDELEKECGIKDAVFCHSSLFMCAANTKEAAISLCQKALKS